jgi:Iap family predicted aminopeptidase
MADEATIDLDALAAKVAHKLQQPTDAKPTDYEIISHGIVNDRMQVMVKTPTDHWYVGTLSNFIEVPNPKV